MRFRKRPVMIEAVRWEGTGRSWAELYDFARDVDGLSQVYGPHPGDRIQVQTLEGMMTADLGDWIIRGVKGEFYPCKPDIFELTYEPVEHG